MNIFEEIKIGSKLDAKGFKQAETALGKLAKTSKNVAASLGVAFSTQAVISFGKAAVKAFAEDDKAARVLSKTLNNLGLAFADPAVKTFIADLEKQYGVLDDFLRPAYQKLVTTTGDWRKSQELLKTALDLSAQSGVDVASVADDLSRAFAGNTKGLQKYGLGLSKTQLAAMSFEEVLTRITKISNGQAAIAADTYAGKLDKLNVAASNASETIGGALVDAFATFAGNGDIDKATAKIDFFSKLLATIISPKLMADTLSKVDFKFGLIPTIKTPLTNRSKSPAGTYARNQAEIKAAAAAKKQQADLLASNKKTLKSQQDALKLAKAKAVFDLQKVQIEAALKGKISEEDRIRLKLMQAIQDENISQIDTYTKALSEVQAKVTTLQSTLAEVYAMDAGNPFISWEIGLDGVKRALIEIGGQSIELTNTIAQNSLAAGLAGGASFAQALSGARYAAQAAAAAGLSGAGGVMPQVPSAGAATSNAGTKIEVTVYNEGSVIAENDLNQSINDALAKSGWAGSAIGYGRQAVITAI